MEDLVVQGRTEEERHRRSAYVWNAAAGIMNAAEAVVMSMIVTRTTGLEDAGALALAFAVGNLLLAAAKYGIRTFQVSDVSGQFRFAVYLRTRILTTAVAGACAVCYLVYASSALHYSGEKCMAIVAICVIYMTEAVEDVFAGAYQRHGRLDVGAKVFCARWTVIFVIFLTVILTVKNMVTALLAAMLSSVVACAFLIHVGNRAVWQGSDVQQMNIAGQAESGAVRHLLTATFPLFGFAFLSFYLNNVPKYAIDRYLSDEVQACYGFVAMPVFVIGLLNAMIYQPVIVPLTQLWESGAYKAFYQKAVKQIIIVALITAACVAGAALIGIPVLSRLYHTDLSAYRLELLLLQGAGCFLALSGYLSVLLTILRRQKVILAGYVPVTILSVFLTDITVRRYSTRGAASAYLLTMFLLCMIYTGLFGFYLKWRNKKRYEVR